MSASQAITEEELLKWLLKMGCKLQDGRAITKSSLVPLIKNNMQPLWEKMLHCVKPAPVAERIKAVTAAFRQAETGATDEQGLLQIRQRRELKAKLREKEAKLKELRAAWHQQQNQLNFQMNEALDSEVFQAQARQEANDHGFQAAVLTAFRQRSRTLIPLVDAWWRELQQVAQLARMRCELLQASTATTTTPPSFTMGGMGMAEMQEIDLQVRQCINAIQAALHNIITPHMDGTAASSAALSNPGTLSARSNSSLTRALSSPTPSSLSPGNDLLDIDLHEVAASPEVQAQAVALAAQPPALVLKALATLAEQEQNQVRQQIVGGDVWAFLEERGIMADFITAQKSSSTTAIMQEKQKEHVKCFLLKEEAEAAAQRAQHELEKLKTHPLWDVAMSKEVNQLVLQEARLKAEVNKLQSVTLDLQSELERLQESDAAARAVYTRTQAFMSRERSLNTLMNRLIRQNVNLSSSWVERQPQAQTTVLNMLSHLEDAVNLTAKVHVAMTKEVEAAMKLPLHLLVPTAVSNPSGPAAPPTLQRQELALTLLAAPDKAGSHSSSTTPANAAAPLAAVLKAASRLDPSAPLQCPTALLLMIAERRCHLEACEALLRSSLSQSPGTQSQLESAQSQLAQLQREHGVWMAEVHATLVPRLQQTLALNAESRSYALGSVQVAMRDWWEQPAMHLVPWRKFMGLSCTEWLARVQALHMELKQGRPVALP